MKKIFKKVFENYHARCHLQKYEILVNLNDSNLFEMKIFIKNFIYIKYIIKQI